jgi:hypothetical protein
MGGRSGRFTHVIRPWMSRQDWVGLTAETNKMELASRPVDFNLFARKPGWQPGLFLFLPSFFCAGFLLFRSRLMSMLL